MSTKYYIGLDVHCTFTEFAVVSGGGKLVQRARAATTIPTIVDVLQQVRRPRYVTFEEGPLAGWLARNLAPHAEQIVVCDPRRNHLVANDGDKDDPLDAEKLAQLYRGGFLRSVHQCESLERAVLKQHVSLYHDRVRERVRQGNQLVAQLRRHGLFAKIETLADPDSRRAIWQALPESRLLRHDLDRLWQVYELMGQQEDELEKELVRLARREEPVRRFVELPGIGWIRGLTLYVYLDTPWRFHGKSALWKYCGLGLERRRSGGGRSQVRLKKQAHRRLKNALLGAAQSAIWQANNPFARKYHAWIQQKGLAPSTARRNTARCLASTLWSLWKTGSPYAPERVRGLGLDL